MEFIKGTIIGMVAGACIGVMKNDMLCDIVRCGKKEIRKIKRKLSF